MARQKNVVDEEKENTLLEGSNLLCMGGWFKLEAARKQVVVRRKGENRLWDEKTWSWGRVDSGRVG